MAENRKSVVVDIVSDSKKFLSGFEEAIKSIEKAARKSDVLGGIQDEIDELKNSMRIIEKELSKINPQIDDSAITKLQTDIYSLKKTLGSFKQDLGNIKIQVNQQSGEALVKLLNEANSQLENLQAQSHILQGLKVGLDENQIHKVTEEIEKLEKTVEKFKYDKNQINLSSAKNFNKMEIAEATKELERYVQLYNKTKSKELISDNDLISLGKYSNAIRLLQKRTGTSLIPEIDLTANIQEATRKLDSFIDENLMKINGLSSKLGVEISRFEVQNGKISVPLELNTDVREFKQLVLNVLEQVQSSVVSNPIIVPLRFSSSFKSKIDEELLEIDNAINGMRNGKSKTELTGLVDNLRKQLIGRDFKLEFTTNLPDMLNNLVKPNISEIQKVLKTADLYLYPQLKLDEEAEKVIREQVEKICRNLKINFGISSINLDSLLKQEEIDKINEQFKKLSINITPQIDLTDKDVQRINKELVGKLDKLHIEVDTNKLQEGLRLAVDTSLIDNWKNKFISAISEVCNKIDKSFDKVSKGQFYEAMKGWAEADSIMRKYRRGFDDSHHKVDTSNEKNANGELERKAYANTKTGQISNSYIVDQFGSVSKEIKNQLKRLYSDVKSIGDIYDTSLHSHPVHSMVKNGIQYNGKGSDLTFSYQDLNSYNLERINEGISKLMIESNGKINELDLSTVDDRIVAAIVSSYKEKLNTLNSRTSKVQYMSKISENEYDIDFSKRAEMANELLANIISEEIAKFNKKYKSNYSSEASKYLKQYDIEALKLNPEDISKEQQEISQLVKLLSDMSTSLSEINKKDIKFDGKNIDKISNHLVNLLVIVKELNEQLKSFGSNEIKLSTEPFEKIASIVQELSDMLKRTFNMVSNSEISDQWNKIVTSFNGLSKIDGTFDARKKEIKELIFEYQKYLDMGGSNEISILSSNKKSQQKLSELYSKQQSLKRNVVSSQNSNNKEESTKSLSLNLEQVISNLQEKNKLFLEESNIVDKAIPNEVTQIEKLIESLSNVKSILEDISVTSQNSGLLSLTNSLNFENISTKKFEEVFKALSLMSEKINTLNFKDSSFISTLEYILSKTDELKNLASILKESKKKIETAKDVVSDSKTSNSSTALSVVSAHSTSSIIQETKEVTNALQAVRQARKEAYSETEYCEGEVIDDTHELIKVYRQAQDEYQNGRKTYQEAYEDMRKGFEEFYTRKGFEYSSADINLDGSFGFNSANIKYFNEELKQTIVDYYRLDKESKQILRTGIQLKDNGTQRAKAIKEENNRIEKARENLKNYIANFNSKTLGQMQGNDLYKELSDFNINNLDDIEKAKILMTQLDTIYTNIMANARKGSTGLNPFVNMVSNVDKAKNALSLVQMSFQELSNGSEDLKNNIDKLKETFDNLEKADGIEEKSRLYGDFRQQINLITNDLQTQKRQEKKSQKEINTHNRQVKLNYQNLISSEKEYYLLSEKIGSGTATETEEKRLEELIVLWNKAIQKKEEYAIKNGGSSNIETSALSVQNKFITSQSSTYSNMVDSYVQQVNSKLTKIKQSGNYTEEFTNKLFEAQKLLQDISSKIPLNETEIFKDEVIQNVGLLKSMMEDIDLGKTQKSNILASITSINKLSRNIWGELDKNSGMAKHLRLELEDLASKLEAAGYSIPKDEFDKFTNQFTELQKQINKSGKVGKSFFDMFASRLKGMNATFFATYFSMQDFIRYGQQAFQTIKTYDTALTEMNKVTNESINTLHAFQKESFKLADSVGTTASQIQNSTADFLRLGESFESAKQSAQDANALLKVSEFESINDATDALISMSQAYNELEKSDINDILNFVGNNFSLSTSDLATALQDAAAVLKTQGNDIYEAVALITAGNAITQDPEKTAGGIRTISLRLAGTEAAKEELESLGESVDDFIVQTESKTQETIKNLTAVVSNAGKGVDVLDSNGNLRNTYNILLDISKIYKEIQEEDKKHGTNRANAIVEYIAGKNRSNIASSILLNPELLESVKDSAIEGAEGSVAREMEAQLQSIESHINSLRNSWEQLWINDNNREVINFFLDLGKAILDTVNELGGLKALLFGGAGIFGAFKALKGEGRAKCYPLFKYAFGEFNGDVYELCY